MKQISEQVSQDFEDKKGCFGNGEKDDYPDSSHLSHLH